LLCWGVTSHIPHTERNVVFLDYDYTSVKKLMRIAGDLQERFGLGAALIARTAETRHHMVFLDCLDNEEWVKVIEASLCHDGYRFHLTGQEYAILRLIKKGRNPAPKWEKTIPAKKRSQHKQSSVHALILRKFWHIPKRMLRLENPDHGQVYESVFYWTDSVRGNQGIPAICHNE
jgi:hypothetical protein